MQKNNSGGCLGELCTEGQYRLIAMGITHQGGLHLFVSMQCDGRQRAFNPRTLALEPWRQLECLT